MDETRAGIRRAGRRVGGRLGCAQKRCARRRPRTSSEGARRGRGHGKGGQCHRGIDSCGDDARWMMGRKGWRMGVFRWAQVGAGRERCGRSKLLAGPSQPSSFRETARTRRWLLRGQQYETAMASGCRRRCWSAEPARLFPGETRILLVEGPWSCAALSYIAPT